ncbi:hypothetical protein MMC10_010767 [Thelotrema lepadinum]|nr:hypothetical protein [Thelotrema lepadinum]
MAQDTSTPGGPHHVYRTKHEPTFAWYGFDSEHGYFLLACDSRLEVDPENQAEKSFVDLCLSVDTQGLGAYMSAQTAMFGTSDRGTKQVTKKAMKKLWRLYEVPSCERGMGLLEQDLKTSRHKLEEIYYAFKALHEEVKEEIAEMKEAYEEERWNALVKEQDGEAEGNEG